MKWTITDISCQVVAESCCHPMRQTVNSPHQSGTDSAVLCATAGCYCCSGGSDPRFYQKDYANVRLHHRQLAGIKSAVHK